MRLIKLAIISAVAIFLLVFLMSLLIPSHVRISRAVNINAPSEQVAAVVQDLSKWSEWVEPVKNAGDMQYNPSEQQLRGEKMEIFLNRTTADSVFTIWRNQHGKEIAGVFCLHQEGGVTVVQLYFDFHQRLYPWEKFASINLDKQWGPPMEKSLENLKTMTEHRQ
jgi:hypothetical protein